MPGTTNWASSRCDRPVPGTAGPADSVAPRCLRLQWSLWSIMQICTKWKLQSEGLTRRHLCNATPHATPNPSAEPLQPGDTLLQPVSNDTYPTTPPRERHLSNTATKGL